MHPGYDLRPLGAQEGRTLARPKRVCRTDHDKHTNPALDLHQTLSLKLLIGLGDGERIGRFRCGKNPDRWQHCAFGKSAIQDRHSDLIAQLEIDGTAR